MLGERKDQHISLALSEDSQGISESPFEKIELPLTTLPDLDLSSVNLKTSFAGMSLEKPFAVGCMTGGTEQARKINLTLAAAAEKK